MDNIDGTILAHQESLALDGRYRRLKSQVSAISCSRKTLLANERLGQYRSHRVIHNGISFDEIPCESSRPREGDSVCRFVYFGQVSEPKGVLQLIRAAARLRSDDPAARFSVDIVGRGDPMYEADLEREIASHRLQGIVTLQGFVNRANLVARLADYDAAVMLLSADEPFAYAPIEAAAAGLPVVMTSSPGNAECFPEKYPLLVADRNRESEVSAKMRWCCSRLPELRDAGLSLRAHLRECCDLDRVTMPSYLRVVRACPASTAKFNTQGLLSSYMTARLYSQIA